MELQFPHEDLARPYGESAPRTVAALGMPDRKPKPKCAQCRKDRQSCLPQPRLWPAKCDRCQKKDLPCSEPVWAPRQAQLRAEDTPASLPRGQKRPLPDLPDSSDSPSPERSVSRGTSAIRNGLCSDSKVQISDLVDAVCMYKLVATEYDNLKQVYSRLLPTEWAKTPERLHLLRSTVRKLQHCLIDKLIKWPSAHDVAHKSAEMLHLEQLQRAILYSDTGIQEEEYTMPGYYPISELNGKLLSSIENTLRNNPSISSVSFAAEMLYKKRWTRDQNTLNVRRLIWSWWREDKGFARMASTATLLNLPKECQTFTFWKSPAVVVPLRWHGKWDDNFFILSLMGADELIEDLKRESWSQDCYFGRHLRGLYKRDLFGHTALHIAAFHAPSHVVCNLMNGNVSLLTTQSDAGHTPLHIAAALGRDDVCRLILESEAGQLSSQLQDEKGWTALWHAVSRCRIGIIRQFLGPLGAGHKQLWRQKDRRGYTLLMHAIETQLLPARDIGDIMDFSDLADRDNIGYTALHHAVFYSRLSVVQLFLLSKNPGAARALQDTGREARESPLECALDNDDDIALTLLNYPGIVVEPTNPRTANLLFYAILNKRAKAARVLALREDIDIFTRDGGKTAEEFARDKGLDDLADFLKYLAPIKRLNTEKRVGEQQTEDIASK